MLGQMAGAGSGFAVWLTSCTLRDGTFPNNANFQWLNQQFAYHNSPSIGDNTPREWYDDIDPKSNKQAWLDAMEDKPGLVTGDNSPIVLSHGTTSSGCLSMHNNKMLKRQILTPMGGATTGLSSAMMRGSARAHPASSTAPESKSQATVSSNARCTYPPLPRGPRPPGLVRLAFAGTRGSETSIR